jgi:hypothetical protein
MSRQDLIRQARTILTPWMNPSTRTAQGRSRTFCLENPPIRFPDSQEKLCAVYNVYSLGRLIDVVAPEEIVEPADPVPRTAIGFDHQPVLPALVGMTVILRQKVDQHHPA